jgi:transcription termination/antitermination protein NusG
MSGRESNRPAEPAQWFALWTHSHAEQIAQEHLIGRGFHTFLPMMWTWSRRAGIQHLIRVPMFPGYLFLRHALDRNSHVEIRKTRGVVRILGERWDCPAVVPEAEIEAIERVLGAGLPVFPHSYLREGQRVRITEGPLADVEGVLIRVKPNKGHLVLSVDLLQRSVAVEVDCMRVAPITDDGRATSIQRHTKRCS